LFNLEPDLALFSYKKNLLRIQEMMKLKEIFTKIIEEK